MIKLINKIHFPFRPTRKLADIVSQPSIAQLEVNDRVMANQDIPLTGLLTVVKGTSGTITSKKLKDALVKWDVFRNQWWVPLTAITKSEESSQVSRQSSVIRFGDAIQPQPQPTGNAPQQKLLANSMGDFANMVAPNQVWQSQSGNFLHLQPNFAVTAKDNNRIVMTGMQWRGADNQNLTPSQPNTLISTDFPFTLRRDMKAVTAARPTHQGEYTWEQFKRNVRAGQIWQTSNSLIRIDRLLENAPTRRQSRFIRFKGAWTGLGPRALRALMPQKNGKFLNSTAPWLVSRMYEPFLMIREGIFEGLTEGISPMSIPDEANAQPDPSTLNFEEVGKVEEYPELELEGPDEHGHEHRHDVHVGIAGITFSAADIGQSLERKILDKYAPDYKEYSIPYRKRPLSIRPRGRPRLTTDTDMRVEALEDILIPTEGMAPMVIPKGTTGAVTKDNGESVYVVWNDVGESFGTVDRNKLKFFKGTATVPELESVTALKFADIISQPLYDKDRANSYYESLASFIQNGHYHETDERLAFNIKYYRVDIPDSVRNAIDEERMGEIINETAYEIIANFVDTLKETYPWITDYEISGRSGGWLGLITDMSQFGQPYATVVWDTLWKRENNLDDVVAQSIEEGDSEYETWAGLADAGEAMDVAFNEIDAKVRQAKQEFIKNLESEEFWSYYMNE